MAVGEFKPGIGGNSLPGQKKKLHSVFPVGDGEAAPAWVAFDRKVLNFSGYFQVKLFSIIIYKLYKL